MLIYVFTFLFLNNYAFSSSIREDNALIILYLKYGYSVYVYVRVHRVGASVGVCTSCVS